ncbi:copper amine oxidase [Gordoniibacillus kamchatkensis]|uniref:Copper amine oxidase n=1 Tax=Gordoniibacillus kamchatkensis TaxID=1590651 RepID=A0ABR5AIB2_9BACL|nr:stalk domain-containing protein [Paenibacillus sp. VKM B-2647]KIL40642.1 copper amine oxidase [Paenibacillus sp. VKM B-2647]
MKKALKVIVHTTSALIITFSAIPAIPAVTSAAQSQASTMALSSQEPITSGATLKKYIWNGMRGSKAVSVSVNVIEVDLTNPNVRLDVMTGTNGQFAKRNTVSGMVKETGAVAGVNGDFYNTIAEGVPDGPEIMNGQLMSTPPLGLQGLYSFAIDKNNQPIVDAFTFKGSVTAKDGSTFPLGGVNKTSYWLDDPNSTYGLTDGMFVYTSAFATDSRTNDGVTVPSEILVQNGVIQQIAIDSVLPGLVPPGAMILKTNGKATDYVKQHLKVGDPIKVDYQIVPMDASKTYDTKSFKMMIGGETLLVDEGKSSILTRDVSNFSGYSTVSRTAIGYSKDLKIAYLITADKNSKSDGMTIPELQDAMAKAGVWRGMVLDGGGSTTMVSRPLGDTDAKLVADLQNGVERRVVNGVGVYSTAPKSTVVKGLFARGPEILFLGEKASYQVKAYDEYYNPMDASAMTAQWSSTAPVGTFQGNEFTAAKSGATKLNVVSGQGQASMDVKVIGRDDIASMTVRGSNLILSENETFRLPVIVTTKDGKTREIPPELVNWELNGFQGSVANGVLTVSSLKGSTVAQIIARYDGYSSMLALPVGQEQLWYDLDTKAVLTTSDKAPAETDAHVNIVQDPVTQNKSLELSYDFTKGKGIKAAYALFNQPDGGVKIDGRPEYMKLKVYGDNSLNWLRALVTDANGKAYYLDLANPINWTGWRTVSLDFSDSKPAYPITLKGIYVANPEQGQDERAPKGKIQIDDISFVYPGTMPALSNNQVKLTVGNRKASVNSQTMTLEQAPVIINGNTMIPVRFAAEALGAKVIWDGNERKVTLLRGGKMIDLWIDSPDLIVNGQRVTAEVAPKIMNNLTMVPLRIIAENMGWKVSWDQKAQLVTLQ